MTCLASVHYANSRNYSYRNTEYPNVIRNRFAASTFFINMCIVMWCRLMVMRAKRLTDTIDFSCIYILYNIYIYIYILFLMLHTNIPSWYTNHDSATLVSAFLLGAPGFFVASSRRQLVPWPCKSACNYARNPGWKQV